MAPKGPKALRMQQEQAARGHPTIILVDGNILPPTDKTHAGVPCRDYREDWVRYWKLADSTLKVSKLREEYKQLSVEARAAWKKAVNDFVDRDMHCEDEALPRGSAAQGRGA